MEDLIIECITLTDQDIKLFNDYMKNNVSKGKVYCVYNRMYSVYGDDLYKLGMDSSGKRMLGYTTYYLDPIIIKHESDIVNYASIAETIVMDRLRMNRVHQDREFFKCDLKLIKTTIDETSKLLNSYHVNNTNTDFIKRIIKNVPVLLINFFVRHISRLDLALLKKLKEVKLSDYKCTNCLDDIIAGTDKLKLIKSRILSTSYRLKFDTSDYDFTVNLQSFIEQLKKTYEDITSTRLGNDNQIMIHLNSIERSFDIPDKLSLAFSELYPKDEHFAKFIKCIIDNECSYRFIDELISGTKTNIDADDVIGWFDIRKDNFKRLLSKFKKDLQYTSKTIKVPNSRGGGTNYAEKIMISYDCLEELLQYKLKQQHISLKQIIMDYCRYIDKHIISKKIKKCPTIGSIRIIRGTDENMNLSKLNSSEQQDHSEELFNLNISDTINIKEYLAKHRVGKKSDKDQSAFRLTINSFKTMLKESQVLSDSLNRYSINHNKEVVLAKLRRLENSEHGIYLVIGK